MTRASALLAGVWEFIVGDDWRIALGVVLALGLTALLADAGLPAWWVMPLAVLGLLALSVRRAARSGVSSEMSSTADRRGIDEGSPVSN